MPRKSKHNKNKRILADFQPMSSRQLRDLVLSRYRTPGLVIPWWLDSKDITWLLKDKPSGASYFFHFMKKRHGVYFTHCDNLEFCEFSGMAIERVERYLLAVAYQRTTSLS